SRARPLTARHHRYRTSRDRAPLRVRRLASLQQGLPADHRVCAGRIPPGASQRYGFSRPDRGRDPPRERESTHMKVTLIGAGSRTFGPMTIRDLLLSEPLSEAGLEIALMDAAAERLVNVESYTRHLADTLGRDVVVTATTDLDSAVSGAQFVVSAIEVDRWLYWAQDFHVPRKYGFRQVFGENGGPGGLFHALRNMGPTIEIARAME